ncbi:hypothetical protein RIR_jg12042.t1 [Rhizophagus irregularis DAOM 181602=DAOM 197198]|nr:hypothetical protein RIR_jg12042.t1 [Rhizophagus irregularis DAOM 181602=DAOM 197198]
MIIWCRYSINRIDLLEETNFIDLILILINGEQTESSSRSSTPNSYRKIEPEIMRRLMNDGKGQPPFKIHTRNSTYYLEEIVLVYSFKTF